MQAHLNTEVTSLATCWNIFLKDGSTTRITDHDTDIVFNGNVYLASIGVTRTAVQDKADMSVDNMELLGILNSEYITDIDIRAGRYDYATVECFLVNHEDPDAYGDIKIRAGTLGEVQTSPINGTYTAEFRGLLDRFTQNTINVIQPECRVDLGSTKCGVVLLAPARLNSISYAQDSLISVLLDTTDLLQQDIPTVEIDPGPSNTDWVFSTGMEPVTVDNNGYFAPNWGTYFIQASGDNAPSGTAYVDFDLTPHINSIEAGAASVSFNGAMGSNFEDTDSGEISILFYDASNTVLQTISTGIIDPPFSTWTEYALSSQVPSNAVKMRLLLSSYRNSGSLTNVCYDLEYLTLTTYTELNGDPINKARFQGLQFRCVTPGVTAASVPAYNTSLGATTLDGTAEFIAEYSFTQYVEVATVSNNRTFTITTPANDSIAVDNWFKYGRVVFLSGLNKGRVLQTKSYTQSTKEVKLLIAAPYPILAGDLVRIEAGCGKTVATYCRDKFNNVKRFRGEPFVPGSNQILSYPNTKT